MWVRQVREVFDREVDGEGRIDDLYRLRVEEREAGAQGFVPADDLRKGELQRRDIEEAAQEDGVADVVSGAEGMKLMKEPEALLGEGERVVLTLWLPLDDLLFGWSFQLAATQLL
jgi:hypothetical protein